MADRPRRGRPPLRRRPSPPTHARRSPSPPRDVTAGSQAELLRVLREEQETLRAEQQRVRDEQLRDREDQRQSRQEVTQLLDTVREMAVMIARLEKRPVGTDTPAETSGQDRVPPPPPAVHFRQVPTAPPVVGTYQIPPPQMPTGASVPVTRPAGSVRRPEDIQPPQFVVGESSRTQATDGQIWDVNRFRKNGGEIFYGDTDPEVALDWIDTARGVLAHIGCPLELWVRVATGAMQRTGKIWWDATHLAYFGGRPLEEISWTEFQDVFYSDYFPDTVLDQKKQEFLALQQGSDLTIAAFQARFLRLERFAPGSFATERQRAARFVAGLRISLRSVVAPFACATLSEAVMRALQCEYAHESFQQTRRAGQMFPQTQTRRAQDQQGPRPQRRRIEDDGTVFAAEGQQSQEPPVCPRCQRTHGGACRPFTRACYTCGVVGHRAAECPSRPQFQQPQYQPPSYQPRPYRPRYQPQYQPRPQQQPPPYLPAPPQRPLLAVPPAQPRGQQLRDGQQPRARQGQQEQQHPGGQQRQAGLAAVEVGQFARADDEQFDDQAQIARPELFEGVYDVIGADPVPDP